MATRIRVPKKKPLGAIWCPDLAQLAIADGATLKTWRAKARRMLNEKPRRRIPVKK